MRVQHGLCVLCFFASPAFADGSRRATTGGPKAGQVRFLVSEPVPRSISEETLNRYPCNRYPWTEPGQPVNTEDAELYRYGVYGQDFTACFTVAPQSSYHVWIKIFQSGDPCAPGKLATTIDIQGKTVVADIDIAATGGGLGKAVVFNDVGPENSVIAIRFWNRFSGEAMVQAVEIGPGQCEPGAHPVQVSVPPRPN